MIRQRVRAFAMHALVGCALVAAATITVAATMPEEARYWVRRFRSRQARRQIQIGPRVFDVVVTSDGAVSVSVDGVMVMANTVEELERHLLRLLVPTDASASEHKG